MSPYIILEFVAFNLPDIAYEINEFFTVYKYTHKLIWITVYFMCSTLLLIVLQWAAKRSPTFHRYYGSLATIVLFVGMIEKSLT
jgi:hypothetical protein